VYTLSKVTFKVIFCFNFFDLSLYDVKYECIFNIKICISVRVLDQFFDLKKKN
jgi:hypothetical protein